MNRRPADRGATTVELAMYTPILFFVLFLTVQVALLFLGNQAASAAAREAARVARSSDLSPDALGLAEEQGLQYAATVGHGLIEDVDVQIEVDGDQVRATVTAHGIQLVPGVPGGDVTQVAQGPVEEFRPDQ